MALDGGDEGANPFSDDGYAWANDPITDGTGHNYPVDTTKDKIWEMTDRPARSEAESSEMEVQVTPEMIEAGVTQLEYRYFDLCDGNEYHEIVRTVFLAMEEVRLRLNTKADRIAR